MSFDLNAPGNKTPLQLRSLDRDAVSALVCQERVPSATRRGESPRAAWSLPRSQTSASDATVTRPLAGHASVCVPVICHQDDCCSPWMPAIPLPNKRRVAWSLCAAWTLGQNQPCEDSWGRGCLPGVAYRTSCSVLLKTGFCNMSPDPAPSICMSQVRRYLAGVD